MSIFEEFISTGKSLLKGAVRAPGAFFSQLITGLQAEEGHSGPYKTGAVSFVAGLVVGSWAAVKLPAVHYTHEIWVATKYPISWFIKDALTANTLTTAILENVFATGIPLAASGIAMTAGVYAGVNIILPAARAVTAFHKVRRSLRENGWDKNAIRSHLTKIGKDIWGQRKEIKSVHDIPDAILWSDILGHSEDRQAQEPRNGVFVGEKCSYAFSKEILDTLAKVPQHYLEHLLDSGFTVRVGRTAGDVKPEKKFEQIWEETEDDKRKYASQALGVCWGIEKEIGVYEYKLDANLSPHDEEAPTTMGLFSGRWRRISVAGETLLHEIGHAVDASSKTAHVSTMDAFVQAYKRDLARFSGKENAIGTESYSEDFIVNGKEEARKKGYGYFVRMEENGRGQSETFAELWAQSQGLSLRGERMARDFPDTYKWIQGFNVAFAVALKEGPYRTQDFFERLKNFKGTAEEIDPLDVSKWPVLPSDEERMAKMIEARLDERFNGDKPLTPEERQKERQSYQEQFKTTRELQSVLQGIISDWATLQRIANPDISNFKQASEDKSIWTTQNFFMELAGFDPTNGDQERTTPKEGVETLSDHLKSVHKQSKKNFFDEIDIVARRIQDGADKNDIIDRLKSNIENLSRWTVEDTETGAMRRTAIYYVSGENVDYFKSLSKDPVKMFEKFLGNKACGKTSQEMLKTEQCHFDRSVFKREEEKRLGAGDDFTFSEPTRQNTSSCPAPIVIQP